MAKKVTIQGSNLLQNLNDDWGGVNNSQGSVTPYSGQGASTPVPTGAEWGMNRGEVERFIKSILTTHEGKIGYFRWSDVVDANNLYHLWGFKTQGDAALYVTNKTTYASLLLVDEALPIANTDGIEAKADNALANIGYYECATSANTAEKIVVAFGYVLTNGGNIRIKMTNANTANNVTLNINSTGAKALYYNGARASATNTWEAGEVLEVYYDGTQYQCASGGGKDDGGYYFS